MLAVVARVFADTVLVAIVLFAFAGTLVWPRAWTLIAVLFLIRVATAITVFRVNPTLLRERARLPLHPAQPRADKLILFSFMVSAFVGVPAIAAFDNFHWHVSRHVPLPLAIFGLALFTAGWVVIALALRANAFAVTVVRTTRANACRGRYGAVLRGASSDVCWKPHGDAGSEPLAWFVRRRAMRDLSSRAIDVADCIGGAAASTSVARLFRLCETCSVSTGARPLVDSIFD